MSIPIRTLYGQIGRLAVVLVASLGALPAEASVITFKGILTAAQVVDGGGSTSTGTGFGVVTIDTTLFTITTDETWTGLSGLVDRSHLHDAPAGQSRFTPPNGDFFHEVLDLSDSPAPYRTVPCNWASAGYNNCAPATGLTHDVLQLSAANGYGYPDFNSLVNAFLKNGVYLDVHTQLYPEGEIRGQLMPNAPEPSSFLFLGLGLIAIVARIKVAKH